MPVYQPNAVIGNSRVLVALGARGELMSLFYPHIDFAQNLREGMPAVYFPSAGTLSWTFDSSWEASQRYLGGTNIVETRLRHAGSGLAVQITDFVHPSEAGLFRRFAATNTGARPVRAKLFQYLDVQLGEVEHKNAVHYHADRRLAVAYWRNICLAVGSDSLEEYGCGRAGTPNSAKEQMGTGRLNRQAEEIGDVDLAVGWTLNLGAGESAVHDLMVAADSSEVAAAERVEGYRSLGWEALVSWARSRWEEHLAAARQVEIDSDLREGYERSLLGLDLLVDPDMGSVLAAPEFDPGFERSGGYGYCWPRDAVEVGLALGAAGYPDYLGRFLEWARRTQRPEGYWEQRYWLSGERGPAWSTRGNGLQIDQTASVLYGMGRHARGLREEELPGWLGEMWESAQRAGRHLVGQLEPETGLHSRAFDLWETFRGSFTYSNAAIQAALVEGAYLARLAGQESTAGEWEEAAGRIKREVMARLWLGDRFARGLHEDGRVDEEPDASALGLILPFGFLSLAEPEEREIARSAVEALVKELGQEVGGAETLRRFRGDEYAGGGPAALTTTWLARVMLRLALAYREEGEVSRAYGARAAASMRAVLAAGTSTGLLPELMGSAPGGHWAVPHAWTMANFVRAALLLDRLLAAREKEI